MLLNDYQNSCRCLVRSDTLVENKWLLIKSVPQLVYGFEDLGPANDPTFKPAPARKIQQHDAKQNCQYTLPGYAWERKQNTEYNQQNAGQILSDDSHNTDYVRVALQERVVARLFKIISGDFYEDH